MNQIMTRDGRKLTISQCVTAKWCEGYNEAIDKIFDELESMTCKNCRFVDTTHPIFERTCKLLGMPCPDGYICNKHEKRYEEKEQ